jgi:hypothetical protein
MNKLFSPEKIGLKNHPEINEKMIQEIIAKDPKIIGLGDLVLKDIERMQPRAGRLDLLMQDPESNRRYEIEIQLGKTDENHIIRTIEYWDIERKRYPQYEHCAVIIAEDITSRFLNVIGLFNGFIPLVAIQMNAFKAGDDIGLIFTKVLDEMPLGLVEEEEDVKAVTNREYWLKTGTEVTMKMADDILDLVKTFKAEAVFKYNKFYIGLAINGQPNNFISCMPKKNYLRLEIKLPRTLETDEILKVSELETMSYDSHWGNYRLRLAIDDIKKHKAMLLDLMSKAEKNMNQ